MSSETTLERKVPGIASVFFKALKGLYLNETLRMDWGVGGGKCPHHSLNMAVIETSLSTSFSFLSNIRFIFLAN